MSEVAITELEFLRKLQRLLNEGDFVATYKFALLNALADLSVEREAAIDGSLRLSLRSIAEKFIEYYWQQARPYRARDGRCIVLLQSTHNQAVVVSRLAKQFSKHPTLAAMRAAADWDALVAKVAVTVERMPLWKLQTTGSETEHFLFRKSEFTAGGIRLLPGVPAAFRALHGLVLDAVRGAWMRQINAIKPNTQVLGNSDLATFLFGSGRGNLAGFAGALRSHQAGRCLYCRRDVRSAGDVDHFIAWSRYPADLGFNLVLSHERCNSKKRDYLAHPQHVESWHRSHVERARELAERFDAARLPHDAERVRAVVWWAYEQGELAGAHVWKQDEQFERLDARWRDALSPVPLARVAESPCPPYDRS